MILQSCGARDDEAVGGVADRDTVKTDTVMAEIPYGTIIPALDSVEWLALTNEYKSLNEHICTSISKFGFCTDDRILCDVDRAGLNKSQAEGLAKTWIEKNGKFTNIADFSKLTVKRFIGIPSCLLCDSTNKTYRDWSLVFGNQIYEGMEVFYTEISMYIDASGPYRVGGNWYSTIHIPAIDSFSLDRAKESLYGDTIRIECFTPIVYIVSPQNIAAGGRKVIIPKKYNNRIELRVAWEIFIARQYLIYVDTTTGRIIFKNQTIIC